MSHWESLGSITVISANDVTRIARDQAANPALAPMPAGIHPHAACVKGGRGDPSTGSARRREVDSEDV